MVGILWVDGPFDGVTRGMIEPHMIGTDTSKGLLITFEGGDGAGKTTQIQCLSQLLDTHHIPHITTREPGGCPQSEAIRTMLLEGEAARWDPVAEALMMAAARRHHLTEVIWPALAKGMWVVCDRFADSTWAYQGYGHGLGEAFVTSLNHLTMGGFQPDLTLILTLPPDEGMRRKNHHALAETDRFGRLASSFHDRVQEGYGALVVQEAQRCIPLDARAPVAHIAHEIERILQERGFLPKAM